MPQERNNPIILVTSCSATKSRPPVVQGGRHTNPSEFCALRDEQRRDCSARELYRGQHAEAVRQAANVGERHRFEVRIVSAGWGVITLDQPICSYEASFTPNTSGFVGNPRQWWNRLQGTKLHELEATLVVALSPPYLDAVLDDLHSCRDYVTVLCRTARPTRKGVNTPSSEVEFSASDVRLRFGGGCVSANARLGTVCAALLSEGTPREELTSAVLRLGAHEAAGVEA